MQLEHEPTVTAPELMSDLGGVLRKSFSAGSGVGDRALNM
jgi:hypothetical protein